MKTHTRYVWFNTQRPREYLNMTAEAEHGC